MGNFESISFSIVPFDVNCLQVIFILNKKNPLMTSFWVLSIYSDFSACMLPLNKSYFHCRATSVGAVSYMDIDGYSFKRDVLFCYDLKLPVDFIPKNEGNFLTEKFPFINLIFLQFKCMFLAGFVLYHCLHFLIYNVFFLLVFPILLYLPLYHT